MKTDVFLDKLMARAKKAGFEAAEAYLTSGDSARISAFEGEVASSSMQVTTGLSFRGMLGGKLGYASTEALDEESLDMLIDRAKDNARTVQDKDEQFIYAPGDAAYGKVDGAFDEELHAAMTPARLIEDTLAMERAAKGHDSRVLRLPYCFGTYGAGDVRIVNTNGLDVSHRDNMAYFIAEAAVDGGGEMLSGMYFWAGNRLADVDAAKVGVRAAREALGYIGAESVASGGYPIVFSPEAWASLLGTFAGVFCADNAQKGLSLLRGREGEDIAGPLVTIVDDPLRPRGFQSRPFDDEGVPARAKEVVAGGGLTTLLHNLKTANIQGVKSTGNASKAGYTAPVAVSPFNFYLKPGKDSPEALYKKMGRGIVVKEMAGLHSGANPVSGDFSLLAKGFLVEGGEIARPVNQFTIAGNFYEVLKNIVALGDDLWFDLPSGAGACGGPSVLVEGISVAGK